MLSSVLHLYRFIMLLITFILYFATDCTDCGKYDDGDVPQRKSRTSFSESQINKNTEENENEKGEDDEEDEEAEYEKRRNLEDEEEDDEAEESRDFAGIAERSLRNNRIITSVKVAIKRNDLCFVVRLLLSCLVLSCLTQY